MNNEHQGKTDDIGHRYVPAGAKPREDRFTFREQVRQRNARRRSEPDHRAAEAHRIGDESPVVAALLQASAVSGMLSNTAETNPSPSAVCHDASGSF